MKKVFKILPALFLLVSLFSVAVLVSNKNVAATPVEAAATGYKVKINMTVTNDADYWEEAYYRIFVRSDNGRGDSDRALSWSENFYNSVSYGGASYTSSETNTGTDFPSYVQIYTGLGAFWQYHWGESDIKVYINGINVASQHITYGGWDYDTYSNWVVIDSSKFPRPDTKKIDLKYSETIDPKDESTQSLKISAVDQYGVNWSSPSSNPIQVVNKTYPENDTAQRLDSCGYSWKLDSNMDSKHTSTYTVRFPTASSVYPIVEKDFKVQFDFPLHLTIMVDNKLAFATTGFAGDVFTIPDLPTPTGYYISNYKKTGVGTIEQDKTNKNVFRFTYLSGDATLTATLKPIQYQIKFEKNGDNVLKTMMNKTATYDAKNAFLPTNYYTREGYKFLGWNTKSDGTGTAIADKGRIPNLTTERDSVVVLYAQWESLNPSVTASLFTDGHFGLVFGGVVAVGSVIAIAVLLMYKSKKREA